MSQIVSIKEFRQNLAHYADLAAKGSDIVIIRRSEPCFKLVPLKEMERKNALQKKLQKPQQKVSNSKEVASKKISAQQGPKQTRPETDTLLKRMKNFMAK